SCPLSSAIPQENQLKCRTRMAGFCYLKLTLDTPRAILARMTDSAASDRSRFYSVAELAQEFSLTSQGIRFYEESGLISPARVAAGARPPRVQGPVRAPPHSHSAPAAARVLARRHP